MAWLILLELPNDLWSPRLNSCSFSSFFYWAVQFDANTQTYTPKHPVLYTVAPFENELHASVGIELQKQLPDF